MPSRPAPATLRALLSLAWPVILARATQSVIGFCDALMVAPLGEPPLAAVTTGAINVFALMIFDAIGMTLSEALRAAGDTAWCMWARLALAWAVFTPGAVLAVIVLGGGPSAAALALVAYLALLAAALAWRFHSGAWRRIQLVEPTVD